MRILILGATGRTGKWMLQETLSHGYEVNCLVRQPEAIKAHHQNLKLFKGTPVNIADLKSALDGCEGIISVLNISRTSDFPWSKLRTPPTFLSEVMKNIRLLAEKNELKRIIVCSAWEVAETEKDLPVWFRWLVKNSTIGVAYRDHERQENELRQSDLNWTIVRPTGLTNFKKEKQVIESYKNKPKPTLMISRKNLAKYMVNALKRDELIGKSPVVSE